MLYAAFPEGDKLGAVIAAGSVQAAPLDAGQFALSGSAGADFSLDGDAITTMKKDLT